MLIVSRKKDQKIIVADEIEITILEIGRNRVRFGIKAPRHIHIQTRLKESVASDQIAEPAQPVDTEQKKSPLEGLPAVVGIPRRL
jgi:carbon storage regulator